MTRAGHGDRTLYNLYRNGSSNRAQAERVRARGRAGEPCGRCGMGFDPQYWALPRHPLTVTCGHPDSMPVVRNVHGHRYRDDELRPEHLRCNASHGQTLGRNGRRRGRDASHPQSITERHSRAW